MAEDNEFPLPPADFSFLVESILMQAQIQLGLLHLGESEDEPPPPPNLALARHSIDLLAMLAEKTKGNLTAEEGRLVENGLTELRFRFVQIAREVEGPQTPQEDTPRIITSDGGKGSRTT